VPGHGFFDHTVEGHPAPVNCNVSIPKNIFEDRHGARRGDTHEGT
jgi:hypothetical protein